MRHALALLALAGCATGAPAEPSAAEAKLLRASLETPQDSELREKARADRAEAQGAGNTYALTCGPVRARFDALPKPAAITARLAVAQTHNAREGGTLAPGATPETLQHPVPEAALLGTARVSVACTVVFDLGKDGVPQAILPWCSDAAYDSLAASAMQAARFKPVLRAGEAVMHKGIVYPMDFCFND
jgi:hypothetical protein